MKPHLLSCITITATLTFPWFFWSKFKTLRGGAARWLLLFINKTSSTSLLLLHSLSHASYRFSLISLFLSSFFKYHPWFPSNFCDVKETAHQLHCHPLILLLVWNFIGFIILIIIPQTQPFVVVKFWQYEINILSVTP